MFFSALIIFLYIYYFFLFKLKSLYIPIVNQGFDFTFNPDMSVFVLVHKCLQ